jgi:hypothetical protein
MEINEGNLHPLGLAIVFFVVASVAFSIFFQLITREAGREVKNPIMELEFVKALADVEAITKKRPEAHQALKTFLILDTFAFVPLYFGFLLLMSFYLSHAPSGWARTAAIIVVAGAILTAAGDWTENFYSYDALDALIAGSQKGISKVFWAAHVKWISIFITIAIISTFFWHGGGWRYGAGAILLLSFLGLTGLFFYRPLITMAISLQLLTILVLGTMFLFTSYRISFLQNQ